MIKISVITSTFNSEKFLVNNLKALMAQSYQNFEHIIYDNCSTDRTHEIIRKYGDSRTDLNIEKDKGIFFALNKCLKKVSGDLIFLYCSDDEIIDPDLFLKISKLYKTSKDLISTNVKIVDQLSLEHKRIWIAPDKKNTIILPAHTGLFIGSYYKNNLFDEKFKISSDFKYLRAIFKDNYSNYQKANFFSIIQRDGGNSTKFWNQKKKFIEDLKILYEDNFYLVFLYPFKIISKILQIQWIKK